MGNNLKTASAVASLADIGFAGETLKEKNAWKVRMLVAGIPGFDLPSNWDELSEEDKSERLEKVLKIGLEGGDED